MRNNRVMPIDAVLDTKPPSSIISKPRSRLRNIKRWIKGLSCGSLSLCTCCMCCGCCGSLALTDVFDNDEEIIKTVVEELTPNEKKVVNSIHWLGAAGLAFQLCLPTFGCCFGCCGLVSPHEATVILSASKNK